MIPNTYTVKKGRTSFLSRIFIQDSTKSDGSGLTGLTSASGSFTCYRARDDDGNAGGTSVTLQSATKGTWTTRGFVEKDATNMPGWYEFGVEDAALATGSESVDYIFKGATNQVVCNLHINLVAYDPQDAVHLGISALPNTACTTNASLLTSGVGTDQISVSAGKVLLQATQSGVTIPTVTTVTNQLTAAQIATGVWQDSTAGDFTTASSIGKSLYTSGAVPGASGGLFIAGSNAATTVNITGTVSTVTTVTNQLTAAQIATGVWQDSTAGDFTTASSIGKSLYTSGVVPGAAGGLFIAGSNASTTVNFTGTLSGSVGSVTAGVTVTTNNDKTGYSLTQAFPTNFSSLSISGGIVQSDVQTIKTQSVTCAAAVTVNVNVGTTQPTNFTGTGGSALVKSDAIDIASQTAQLDANNLLKVDVEDVTGGPAVVPSGVNVTSLNGDTVSVGVLQAIHAAIRGGTVDSSTTSPSTTVFETSFTSNVGSAEFLKQGLIFTTGTNAGVTCQVSGYSYTGNSKVQLTVTPAVASAPSNGDAFKLIGKIGV